MNVIITVTDSVTVANIDIVMTTVVTVIVKLLWILSLVLY